MSSTGSHTTTYTQEDISKVFRRFTADLKMIAASSKSITESKAAEYAYDVEYLAQRGYLKMVDVTLLSGGVELKAVQYSVVTASNDLTPSRPGDVLWPEIYGAFLRILLTHTSDYTAAVKTQIQPKLKIGWVATDASTDHLALKEGGGRDYSSNGFGVNRKDFK